MRVGLVADSHIIPEDVPPETFEGVLGAGYFHNPYRLADAFERLGQSLEACVKQGADCIVLLGDVVHLGDEDSLVRAVQGADELGLTVWIVPGNHDPAGGFAAVAQIIERAEARNVKLPPPEGVVLAGGVRIASADVTVMISDGGRHSATIELPRAESWGNDAVLFVTHYPMISRRPAIEGAGLRYVWDVEGAGEVLSALNRRGAPTIVAHGHLHVRDLFAQESTLQVSCASLIEAPFEVSILEVQGDRDSLDVGVSCLPVQRADVSKLPVLVSTHTSSRWDGESWSIETGSR